MIEAPSAQVSPREHAARLLDRHGLPFVTLSEMSGGTRHRVVGADERYVVRFSPTGDERLLEEARLLGSIRGRVRAPEIVHAGRDGAATYQIQAFVRGGHPLRLWAERDRSGRRRMVEALRRQIEALHAVGGEGFGPFGADRLDPTWGAHHERIVGEAIEAAAARLPEGITARHVDQSRRFLAENLGALAQSAGPCLTHNDVWPGNLLVAEDRITLIDFELATWGAPDLDVFKLEYFCRQPSVYGMATDCAGFMSLLREVYPEIFPANVATRLDIYDLSLIWRTAASLARGRRSRESGGAGRLAERLDDILAGRIRRLVPPWTPC